MSPYGKHARDPREVQVGKHGVTMRANPNIAYVILAIVLVAVVCLVPLTLAKNRMSTEPQAFADSTRTAFGGLSDTELQANEDGTLPGFSVDYTSNVTEKLQNSIMSGGCEIVALGIVLDSMGIDADLHNVVSSHLTMDGHFATGYSGSPYSKGAGYPPGIANAANSYLTSLGVQARAHDLTGSSFDKLEQLVGEGYPVMVWTTMRMQAPQFTGAYDNGSQWYDNEHCVVLYGVGEGSLRVSDPLEGLVERDRAQFSDLYAQCGSMALAIY